MSQLIKAIFDLVRRLSAGAGANVNAGDVNGGTVLSLAASQDGTAAGNVPLRGSEELGTNQTARKCTGRKASRKQSVTMGKFLEMLNNIAK
jgi:hypothetical protein